MRQIFILPVFILIYFIGNGCAYAQSPSSLDEPTFVENEIFEDRSRRKFGNPVIGDLDQDGYLDLLLTDHARRVELYWNNAGTFTLGQPFIFGDTHGIALGDFDRDGLIDVTIQPGGGGGNNPRQVRTHKVNLDRTVGSEVLFTNIVGGSGRAVKMVDENSNGAVDMITTFWPKVTEVATAHHLLKNTENSPLPYEFVSYLPTADRWNIRASLIDYNGDNITDVIFYGGNQLVIAKGEGNFTYSNATSQALPGSLRFINNTVSVSEIDFDNDGDLDLFLTRARTPFGTERDYDEESNNFYFFNRQESNPWDYDNIEIDGDFELENLQMAFPDFNVYIGENKDLYQRVGDSHGQHDFTITKTEGAGWPDDTSENGLYIGYLGNNIWRVAGITKSATSAVIHNVLSGPTTVPLANMPAKLLENRDGQFVDATASLGIDIPEQATSSAIGDYNNDGWDDIFVLRYGIPSKPTEQILYLNQGGTGFVRSTTHGIVSNELGATGMGAEAFDYDKDGDLDIIYCNERGRWHLYTNTSASDNNWVQINIGSSPNCLSTAVNAKLSLNICGKTYERTVSRSSAPYSQSFNTYMHVGLGACDTGGTATVTWGNGEEAQINITDLNKIYKIGFDGQCPALSNSTFEASSGIEIFPNPTTNKLMIKSVSHIETISIYDITGRLVLSKDFDENTNEQIEINTEAISKGTYIIKLHSLGKTLVKKMIKE